MSARLTPMIRVPDVRATALWYASIGFALAGWHACDADEMGSGVPPEDGAEWDWALLRYGAGAVMLNAGGRPSDSPRREVDLYVQLEPGPDQTGVDALHEELRNRVEIVEPPYDAFHGNRELIVRDPNGFWITFAQPVSSREPKAPPSPGMEPAAPSGPGRISGRRAASRRSSSPRRRRC